MALSRPQLLSNAHELGRHVPNSVQLTSLRKPNRGNTSRNAGQALKGSRGATQWGM